MVARVFAIACLLVGLLVVTACDPKEMIEKKVPEPLKGVLSPGSGAKKGAVDAKEGGVQPSALEITSPKANSVLSVAKDLIFEAKLDLPPTKDEAKPQVIWTLFSGQAQKGVQIGRGEKVTKKLDPGRYRVQAALVYRDSKIEKQIPFRVACMVEGGITTSDGAALPGMNVILTEIGGTKPLFQAQSDRGGKFLIEIPQQGFFELTPRKQGYSFFPYGRVVKFVVPLVQQDFKGTRAEIKDITFAEEAGSRESVDSVCPLQEGYVRFSVESEVRPRSVEAQLVRVEEGQECPIQLEDLAEDSAAKRTVQPEGTVLKVQVPSVLAVGPKKISYRLRLTIHDEKKNVYAAEAPKPLSYDVMHCFRKTLADGVQNQENGKLEQAIAAYHMIAKYNEKVDNQTPFAPFVKQSTFNRGLAYLGMAITKNPESIDRLNLLQRAIPDFQTVLQYDKKDPEAMMFLGLCFQLLGSARQALEYYYKVLEVDPNFPGVRELRAQAQLQMAGKMVREARRNLAKVKQGSKNIAELTQEVLKTLEGVEKPVQERLLAVVDDFTAALSTRPDDESVRQSRRQVLKTVHELGKGEIEIGEFKTNLRKLLAKEIPPKEVGHPVLNVEVSEIPLRDLQTVVDSGKYLRK